MIDLNIVHLFLIFLGIIFLIKIAVSMLSWITSPFFCKKETEVLPHWKLTRTLPGLSPRICPPMPRAWTRKNT